MKHKLLSKASIYIIFIIYIILLLKTTVFRYDFFLFGGSVNLYPFFGYFYLIEAKRYFYTTYLFVGNIICFVPFGILVPLISKRNILFSKTLVLGFILSLAIETAQYILGTGISEVDDLILNTIGVLLGYLIIYKLIYRRQKL